MVVIGKVLVVGGIIVVGYGIYACSCRLRRRWYAFPSDLEKAEDLSEPLLHDDYHTVKRSKLSDGLVNNRLNDEDWSTSVAPGATCGDQSDDSPTISADIYSERSYLSLEVISGPSLGGRISKESSEKIVVCITVGRISQNDLVLNDPEVSGKHALITWNSKVSKWELVDMGSLNGTLVNQLSITAKQPPSVPTRQRGSPVVLVNGDIITLGSTSQVKIRIQSGVELSSFAISSVPFGVGIAADPMSARKGGKPLPMEDVCLCEWPLRGFQEFGVFCIFDGHGGVAAAEAACRILPQKLSEILSVEDRRSGLLNHCDAAEVLKDALRQTEDELDNEYEGCTATVLLLWSGSGREFYAQCANVGDSACIFSIGEKHITVTEDHRLTSYSERCRLLEMGRQLKEGENRLCGMNIARALGDKFLKEQDGCFSSEPYVSEVLRIEPESRSLALLASDGLWDTLSLRRALNLAFEARDGRSVLEGWKAAPQNAQGIAEMLVSKARLHRTKDNTSVIVLDFGSNSKPSFHTV